jgi:hypothetical protein
LERDFLVILDFDPNALEIAGQPVTIEYLGEDGRIRRYTPDFYVRYANGDECLYEIKYRSNLWEEWKSLKPKFKAARRYAKEHGMRFVILTDVEIRGTAFLENARFLRHYRDLPRDPGVEEHLVSTLAVLGETTPEAVLIASYWTLENRMKAVAPLWRLVATGRVHADLSLPLTMSTPIWVILGEGYIWPDPHSYHSPPAR